MSYTVDNLLEKIAIVGQNKVWEEIPETITVKGVVSNIKLYSNKSYFDLIGFGKKIRACCDAKHAPSEGAAIEFKGLVTLKTSTHSAILHVIITGVPVGTWEEYSKESLALSKDDLVKYNNHPLSSLIGSFKQRKLFLIGSKNAVKGLETSLNNSNFINTVSTYIDVSDKVEVLSTLKVAKEKLNEEGNAIAAFAFVSAGDDDAVGVWDDPIVIKAMLDVGVPFFTALGHAHRLTLADKYAAQTFPTFSNFADSLNIEVNKYEDINSLRHDKMKLTEELNENDIELRNIEESNKSKDKDINQLTNKYKGLKKTFWITFLLFILALVAIFVFRNELINLDLQAIGLKQ